MTTIVDVLEGRARWCVELGDCLELMRAMPDGCVDAVVTDPPAGIGFMGKEWDSDKGGRDGWIAWLAERMREALRVLKPGGHALVWAIPRTSHWTAMALEDAGFEIRDRVSHIFGSGFPKSLDMPSAAVAHGRPYPNEDPGAYAAIDWMKEHREGYGTALKPAVEDWWLVRKPFRGGIAPNVLEHGTGALNINGCRVPHASAADFEAHAAGVAAIKARGGSMDNSWKNSSDLAGAADVTNAGRWPAHLVLSHADGCERVGTKKIKAPTAWGKNERPPAFTGAEVSPIRYADEDGTETIADWQCVDGCQVRELDEQSGILKTGDIRPYAYGGRESPTGFMRGTEVITGNHDGDSGGASRYFTTFPPFFYTPKASRDDRELGCEHLPKKTGGELTDRKEGSAALDSPRTGAGRRGGRANHHPTVKSTELMRFLVRLPTPPRGVVLDLFTGSGSTGVACSAEGFRFIGLEIEPEYVEIARARIVGDAPLFNAEAVR